MRPFVCCFLPAGDGLKSHLLVYFPRILCFGDAMRATWNTLKDMGRAFSPILAGFKLAIILVGYIGVGSIAKWIVEQWYPFTRWMWDNIFVYLDLPKLSQIEKDSLTALLFFLPLGASCIWSLRRTTDDQRNPSLQIISGALGTIFFIVLCWDVVRFTLQSTTPAIVSNLEKDHQRLIEALNLFYYNPLIGIAILLSYVTLVMMVYFIIRRKIMENERWRNRLRRISKFSVGFFAFTFLILAISASMTADSILPFISVLLIISIVVLSVLKSPLLLLTASGASLAFILSALTYEACLFAISFIESAHNNTNVL